MWQQSWASQSPSTKNTTVGQRSLSRCTIAMIWCDKAKHADSYLCFSCLDLQIGSFSVNICQTLALPNSTLCLVEFCQPRNSECVAIVDTVYTPKKKRNHFRSHLNHEHGPHTHYEEAKYRRPHQSFQTSGFLSAWILVHAIHGPR